MNSKTDFQDQVALVTGGASGIGAAVTERIAAAGASVVIADSNLEAAERAAQSLRDRNLACAAVQVDVSAPESVARAVEFTVQTFGALHLAVNNAGIPAPEAKLGNCALEDWHRVLDVDLSGVFYCLRCEIPAVLASGGGAIVNVASVVGLVGAVDKAPYVAAKHGVVGLTKAAALDYAGSGVRVNAVAPGFVDTPMVAGRGEATRAAIAALHPMDRMARPGEVAELITFLLSERAAFITGSCHLVDGGYAAR